MHVTFGFCTFLSVVLEIDMTFEVMGCLNSRRLHPSVRQLWLQLAAHARASDYKVVVKSRTDTPRTHVCIIIGFQTQGTQPLGRQNCKWPSVLRCLAWFTRKKGELRNGCFFNPLVEKLEKNQVYLPWL